MEPLALRHNFFTCRPPDVVHKDDALTPSRRSSEIQAPRPAALFRSFPVHPEPQFSQKNAVANELLINLTLIGALTRIR